MTARIKLSYDGLTMVQGDAEAPPGAMLLDASGDLVSFDYTDNRDGHADDLEITLMDKHGLWRSDWMPRKGAKLLATIIPAFGEGELPCGDMWIDEVEASGPPSEFKMKALSLPLGTGAATIRGTRKTRTWESATFEQIAGEIARAAGMKLHYQGPAVEIDRTDQHEESDLALLHRLGADYGYVVKVAKNKIVVYDQEILEDAETVAAVDVGGGDGMVTRWGIRSKTRDVYRAARVMYLDPIRKLLAEESKEHHSRKPPGSPPVLVVPKKRGTYRRLTTAQRKAREQARQDRAQKTFDRKNDHYLDSLIRQTREEDRRGQKEVEVDDDEFLFAPGGAPVVDDILEITRRAKDEDEAKRIAERMLRNANRDEVTLSLDLVGDVAMRAGLNIDLLRAGAFSGKYHIDRARHHVGGGYVTSVDAHRVLMYR